MEATPPKDTDTGSQPETGAEAAAGASPGPDTSEQPLDPEGQRAWIAQIERRLSTRTFAGAAALVLALATGIVALVMAMDARDNSATNADLEQVEKQLGGVAEQAGAAEDLQSSLDSLSERIDAVEDEVEGLSSADGDATDRLGVVEDDVEDLRQQISDLESAVDDAAADAAAAADSSDSNP